MHARRMTGAAIAAMCAGNRARRVQSQLYLKSPQQAKCPGNSRLCPGYMTQRSSLTCGVDIGGSKPPTGR